MTGMYSTSFLWVGDASEGSNHLPSGGSSGLVDLIQCIFVCQVITVGIGTAESGLKFSELLNYPAADLYADPDGKTYKALGFNPGFAPDAQVSGYLKLLPMLAGVGSPGTMQEVRIGGRRRGG